MTATHSPEPSTSNLEPATSNSTPFLAHRRTGKVARLPDEERELVNLMLYDGAPYSRVMPMAPQTPLIAPPPHRGNSHPFASIRGNSRLKK